MSIRRAHTRNIQADNRAPKGKTAAPPHVEPSKILHEIKSRISDEFSYLGPDGDLSKMIKSLEQDLQQDNSNQDIVSDNSDPRLEGWTPRGLGICGPRDCRLEIEEIEDSHKLFDHLQHRTVSYWVELPSGERTRAHAFFTRQDSVYAYDIGALRKYLESQIGEDLLERGDRLNAQGSAIYKRAKQGTVSADEVQVYLDGIKDRQPELPEPYFKYAFSWLYEHLATMEVIEHALEPLGAEGRLLLKAIENRVNSTFSIALSIREGQLADIHEADALSGKKRRATSKAMGRQQGEKRTKEADAKWRTDGLALAKNLRSKFPHWGQKRIATKLMGELDQNGKKMPEVETVIRQIRAWEAQGRLPRSSSYRTQIPKG